MHPVEEDNSRHQTAESLRAAAESGDVEAMVDFAFALQTEKYSGRSMKMAGRNIGEGSFWFHRAAEAGQAEACSQWAMTLLSGRGFYRDGTSAVQYLRRAADAGHGLAALNLSFLLRRGDGVIADPITADAYLRQARAAGIANENTGTVPLSMTELLAPSDPWTKAQILIGLEQSDKAIFAACRAAADAGIAAAFVTLADLYYRGAGVRTDKDEALRWLQAAAESGDIEAQCRLGYLLGIGDEKRRNPQTALHWLHRANDAGDAMAPYYLGIIARDGLAGEANPSEAARWFALSVARDAPTALALITLRREGKVPAMDSPDIATLIHAAREEDERTGNWASALDKLMQAAELGSGAAAERLGFYYHWGQPGIDADIAKAASWYRRAAGKQRKLAMAHYANFSLFGHGRPADLDEAERWYEALLDKIPFSVMTLADHLAFRARHGPWDPLRAGQWYLRGAAKGVRVAWRQLGLMALDGYGLTQDYKTAALLLKTAAEAGDTEAAYQLGCLYRDGHGVKQNHKTAAKWFAQAGPDHFDAVRQQST